MDYKVTVKFQGLAWCINGCIHADNDEAKIRGHMQDTRLCYPKLSISLASRSDEGEKTHGAGIDDIQIDLIVIISEHFRRYPDTLETDLE